MRQLVYDNKGFMTLLGVLTVGAIGTAIAVSVLAFCLGNTHTSIIFEQSNQAKAVANACAEQALNKLRLSASYAGNESLTFSGFTCQIYAVQGSGNTNRTIQASSTVGTTIRKAQIIVAQIKPTVILTSWQEVDF